MIVVTGATGQLGSQVVHHLLDRLPPDQVGVSVRDPARASDLAARGVRVRRGDFAEPDTLAEAFEGASQVLVVSSDTLGAEGVALHRAAADAARDAGATRVLYTSHQGASAGSVFTPMPDHAATEDHLRTLGTAWTSLRNGFYASTVPRMIGGALETGELAVPADGPVSWTTHADLAEATAVLLADEGLPDGPTPPLTAPEAHDFADVARMLGDLTGRTVRRVVVEDEDWVRGLVDRGVPREQAEMLLLLFLASRRGEFAATDPTLEKLVGRPATSLREVLAAAV
ncbi:NAD(P)H-binding protein [Solicola sp. PLA-1-18]|uniref:NAD(P)H-binding protein n=1 Tax=Solicola sp. PLA-1-18 TaxID=3380532 RepID=UPI003B7E097E